MVEKGEKKLRRSNKQSRIFRLNDVIMAGISVQIANNTNLNHRKHSTVVNKDSQIF